MQLVTTLEFKQSTVARVPVTLTLTGGGSATGILFGAVSATIQKSDGTTLSLSVTSPDWAEISAGSFSGTGFYNLLVPSTALNLAGVTTLIVKATGCDPYAVVFNTVPHTLNEAFTAISGVQTSVNASATQAGLDALNENLAVIDARSQIINDVSEVVYQHHMGRWKIFSTGPDANKIVYYRQDGTTVVAKFDLKDAAGGPTFKSAFERVPSA